MKDEDIYPKILKNDNEKINWQSFIVGALYGLLLRALIEGKQYLGISEYPLKVMGFSFAILAPLVIGAITVYIAEKTRRRTFGYYFIAPWVSILLCVFGTAIFLLEGSICIAMALPLFLLLSSIGGITMGLVCRYQNKPKTTLQCVALLPFVIAFAEPLQPLNNDFQEIKRSVHISAPVNKVWHLVNFPTNIKPEELKGAWSFAIGVPYPIEARTLTTGVGGKRHLIWQRGVTFNEEIIAWQENRYIAWTYLFDENSFPPGSMDDHVVIGGKYFNLENTSYTLIPEKGGTRLEISVRIRVSTSFNWYSKPLATALTRDTAETILKFYKNRAEAKS